MDGRTLCYRDELVDVALEQTFPASDPPAFVAAAAMIGTPRNRSREGGPIRSQRLKSRRANEVKQDASSQRAGPPPAPRHGFLG
jgi:hypothetical protein